MRKPCARAERGKWPEEGKKRGAAGGKADKKQAHFFVFRGQIWGQMDGKKAV